PIYLTSVRPVAPARTTKIRNTAPATGRLTGAVPAEENLVMADQSAPQSNTTGPNASSVSASNPSTEKSALQNPLEAMRDKPVSKPRSSQDLIKAVLNAQAAAWNEGNLLAFMSGYWDSPDLRLVSGENVTRGYAKALKRYRSRYGDGAGMGNLGFQNLDVQMLDQDVAIVVGRYSLNRDADASTGSFSLVMRRFNGLWRIVHDHTSADPVVLAEQEG
ncbi:MAG: nuclear transport factor 2 family protein, partial [Pseudomonadota bacterium]